MKGKIFQTQKGQAKILRFLGKGKSGYSYLVEINGSNFVLKLMHKEACEYYNFSDNKTKLEVQAYKNLCKIGIPIPKLYEYDFKKDYLLKEFIDGKIATELIIKAQLSNKILIQLFEFSQKAKKHNLNLDFFPKNFVIIRNNLFYVDYEINPYIDEWNLQNWGLFYWANSEGMKNYVQTNDSKFINENLKSGKPIKKPFLKQISIWVKLFDKID